MVQLIHYREGSGARNPGFNFLWFWSQHDGGSYLITSFLIVVKRSFPMVGPSAPWCWESFLVAWARLAYYFCFFNLVSSTSLLNFFLLVAKWASITILQQKSRSIHCLSLLGKIISSKFGITRAFH